VTERLGDPFAPRSFSLIAIHKHGIPDVFSEEVLAEATTAAAFPLGEGREDLTGLPIVAIDPIDARDHDDAVWATPDDDPANPAGGRRSSRSRTSLSTCGRGRSSTARRGCAATACISRSGGADAARDPVGGRLFAEGGGGPRGARLSPDDRGRRDAARLALLARARADRGQHRL
jgi:hypothetical protein